MRQVREMKMIRKHSTQAHNRRYLGHPILSIFTICFSLTTPKHSREWVPECNNSGPTAHIGLIGQTMPAIRARAKANRMCHANPSYAWINPSLKLARNDVQKTRWKLWCIKKLTLIAKIMWLLCLRFRPLHATSFNMVGPPLQMVLKIFQSSGVSMLFFLILVQKFSLFQ